MLPVTHTCVPNDWVKRDDQESVGLVIFTRPLNQYGRSIFESTRDQVTLYLE